MTRPRLDTVAGLAVPGFAVVVVLGSGVLGVSTWVAAGAAVSLAALAVVVAHVGLDRVGLVLLALGVGTSTWNAVSVGPLKLSHAALALAAVLLGAAAVADGRPVRVPGWIWVLSGTVAVTIALTLVWPPSTAYFAARDIAGLTDQVASLVPDLGRAGLVAGLKWLVAVLALPLAVCLASVRRPGFPAVLADAFVAGATVGAGVAVSDRIGITHITVLLTDVDYVESGRQAGLSVHPNHLALGLAMALPLAVWRLARSRHAGGAAVLAGACAVMSVGLLTTGSRAGVVGAVLSVLVAALLEPRARRCLPGLAAFAAVAALLVVALEPSLLSAAGESLRLAGADSADASDAIRAGLGDQALADVAHSPVHGIGLAVVAQAHDIYLQLLASGGVVLFVGYVAGQAGFLRAAWSVPDGGSGLGRIAAVAGGTFLVIGVVGNQLPDVFVSVPLALAAGLWAARPAERVLDELPDPLPEREDITS